MNWKLIVKDIKKQPAIGTYTDWKEQIAEECFFQCVYCSIHESQFGGIDHYHIDHFKPKIKFPKHINDILNLFYTCPICNRFKNDDWPGEPDLNTISYIEPSKYDYALLFDLNKDFELEGKYTASKYMVLRLYLNRAQLILERREAHRRNRESELRESINTLLLDVDKLDKDYAFEIVMSVTQVFNNLLTLEQKKREIRQYKLSDIRKS